jgi:Lon protease-like protein
VDRTLYAENVNTTSVFSCASHLNLRQEAKLQTHRARFESDHELEVEWAMVEMPSQADFGVRICKLCVRQHGPQENRVPRCHGCTTTAKWKEQKSITSHVI